MEANIDPWGYSRYSHKVAKTPNRTTPKGVWWEEIEADLSEIVYENLLGDTLVDIERITGEKLIDKFPYGKGLRARKGLAPVIAGTGHKREVLNYLRMKQERATAVLKEDPFFDGRFYYNEYLDDEWKDPLDLIQQKLEGNLNFWRFLEDLIMKLTVEPEPEQQPNTGIERTEIKEELSQSLRVLRENDRPRFSQTLPEWQPAPTTVSPPDTAKDIYTFDTVFRSPEKRDHLLEILKNKYIIDESGYWISRETDLVGLYCALIERRTEKNLIKEYKPTKLYRIFCKKFFKGSYPFTERTGRAKPKKEILNEYIEIIDML